MSDSITYAFCGDAGEIVLNRDDKGDFEIHWQFADEDEETECNKDPAYFARMQGVCDLIKTQAEGGVFVDTQQYHDSVELAVIRIRRHFRHG